jgi:hypothetical protein
MLFQSQDGDLFWWEDGGGWAGEHRVHLMRTGLVLDLASNDTCIVDFVIHHS